VGNDKAIGYRIWMLGDDVIVPCGHHVPSGVKNNDLLYNEYLVYDLV
jgi:hypothetical protein